jgi:hypothetical protein
MRSEKYSGAGGWFPITMREALGVLVDELVERARGWFTPKARIA